MTRNVLERGAAWLADRLASVASRSVTYSRGNNSVTVRATIGRTVFEFMDEFGAARRVVSRDFLVRPEALILNGAPIEPRAGDRVRETVGSATYVYEVMAPGNEPVASSDPYGTILRIHTKLIGTMP